MNKAQQRARIEELENKIEEWQEIGSQYGDAFETPQDIVYMIEGEKELNEKKINAITSLKQEAEQKAYILEEEKDQLEAKELYKEEEIIENYFANEKLRETSWTEWKDMEGRNNDLIHRNNEMVKEMDIWKQKFIDRPPATQLRDANLKIELFEEFAFGQTGVGEFK